MIRQKIGKNEVESKLSTKTTSELPEILEDPVYDQHNEVNYPLHHEDSGAVLFEVKKNEKAVTPIKENRNVDQTPSKDSTKPPTVPKAKKKFGRKKKMKSKIIMLKKKN